jgi:hypothetical protein
MKAENTSAERVSAVVMAVSPGVLIPDKGLRAGSSRAKGLTPASEALYDASPRLGSLGRAVEFLHRKVRKAMEVPNAHEIN